MRFPVLITILFATCLVLPAEAQKDRAFQALAKTIVEEHLRLNPDFATRMGDHRWDDRLPNFSAKGRADLLAWARSKARALRYFMWVAPPGWGRY